VGEWAWSGTQWIAGGGTMTWPLNGAGLVADPTSPEGSRTQVKQSLPMGIAQVTVQGSAIGLEKGTLDKL